VPGDVVSFATACGAAVIGASTAGLAWVQAQRTAPTSAAAAALGLPAGPGATAATGNPLVSGGGGGGSGGEENEDLEGGSGGTGEAAAPRGEPRAAKASDVHAADAADEHAPLAARRKNGKGSEAAANGGSSSSGTRRLVAVLTPTSARKTRAPYATVGADEDGEGGCNGNQSGGGDKNGVGSSGSDSEEDDEGPLPDIGTGVDWTDVDTYGAHSNGSSSSSRNSNGSSGNSSHGNGSSTRGRRSGSAAVLAGMAPSLAWNPLGNGDDPWGDAEAYEATHFEVKKDTQHLCR
jgi:hypothetical protein